MWTEFVPTSIAATTSGMSELTPDSRSGRSGSFPVDFDLVGPAEPLGCTT